MTAWHSRFESRHARHAVLPLHRHRHAYIAIVVAGGYLESSIDGAFWCDAGCVVVHPRLHAHANRFPEAPARVLNIAGSASWPGPDDTYRVLRLSGMRPLELVRSGWTDLPDVLEHAETVPAADVAPLVQRAAALLREDLRNSISMVADVLNVSREHLTRAFQRALGLSPVQYRTELRLQRGMALLRSGWRLSRIAHDCGFADHAHFCRTMHGSIGMTPSAVRGWLSADVHHITSSRE